MKIFLTGYMGSGKSLVARNLAQQLNSSFIDLDDQISLMEGMSIPEIFKTRGELYFRNLETKVLSDVLKEPASLIVALGGGTPCYGNNLELIKSYSEAKTVYLRASVGFLRDRLYNEASMRPVISHLKTKEDLEDFIRKHLFERSFYYNQADTIIHIEGKTPDDISEEVIKNLK